MPEFTASYDGVIYNVVVVDDNTTFAMRLSGYQLQKLIDCLESIKEPEVTLEPPQ